LNTGTIAHWLVAVAASATSRAVKVMAVMGVPQWH
jgi:hypothetical protein